jgi:hypothetical protein
MLYALVMIEYGVSGDKVTYFLNLGTKLGLVLPHGQFYVEKGCSAISYEATELLDVVMKRKPLY